MSGAIDQDLSLPNVPEALTCGDERDEALAMAEDALAVALGSYMRCREDITVPDSVADQQEVVAVPRVVAAKLALYTALRRFGSSWTGRNYPSSFGCRPVVE